MIDFRYHVVSIVAVFLALALGLFVGSTTLQSTVADQLSSQAQRVRSDNQRLEKQLSAAHGTISDDQSFAAAVEPLLVRGRLTGQTVALVSAPGVSDSARSALAGTLQEAGATVTADVRLAPAYLDPTQQAELGQLAHDLAAPGHPPGAGSGVDQASQTLAEVLGARVGRSPPSPARVEQTLAAFGDGKLLSVKGPTPRPAALVVVLVPPADASVPAATVEQQAATILNLARDLDATAAGAVLAGPTVDPTQPAGVLDIDRRALGNADSGVSTVDGVDQPQGRVASVYALAQQLDGRAGSYGPTGAAPLPTPSPTR